MDFKIESFFLITAIFLGVVYLILYTPYYAPDSAAHFLATYSKSNQLMGFGRENEWLIREADRSFFLRFGRSPDASIQDYYDLINSFRFFATERQLVDMEQVTHMDYYSPIGYLPQILGIIIGRVLGLSPIITMYLARIMTLLAYTLGLYNAVKVTPIGKGVFVFMGIIPGSLYLSSPFSYDAMVVITTMNMIACIFALYKEIGSNKVLIQTMVWTFLVGATKGGGYLIMLPLVFILLFGEKGKKRKVCCICLIVGIGLISLILNDLILPPKDIEFFQMGYANSSHMMVMDGVKNPLLYLHMLFVTVKRQAYGLALCLWVPHYLPVLLTLPFVIVVILYSFLEIDEVRFDKCKRVILLVTVIISFMTTPIMLLSYTPKGSDEIIGLQSRYFLPYMIPLILFLTKIPIREGGKDDNRIPIIKNLCMECFAMALIISVFFLMGEHLSR